jgi:hypothetical protein
VDITTPCSCHNQSWQQHWQTPCSPLPSYFKLRHLLLRQSTCMFGTMLPSLWAAFSSICRTQTNKTPAAIVSTHPQPPIKHKPCKTPAPHRSDFPSCTTIYRGQPRRSATHGSSSVDRLHRTTQPLLPSDDTTPATARHCAHRTCPGGLIRPGALPIEVVRASVRRSGAASCGCQKKQCRLRC